MADLPEASFLRLEKTGAVIVDIHVIPNAAHTVAAGLHDGALRVRLNAPPVDGKANSSLVQWLAQELDIPRAQIELVRGQTSKRKQLRVSATVANRARWQQLMSGAGAT